MRVLHLVTSSIDWLRILRMQVLMQRTPLSDQSNQQTTDKIQAVLAFIEGETYNFALSKFMFYRKSFCKKMIGKI